MTEITRILRLLDEAKEAEQQSPFEQARTQTFAELVRREQERLDESERMAQKSLSEIAEDAQADIASLAENAQADIEAAQTLAELEQLRVGYLGRSAPLTELKRRIRELPVGLRPQIGGAANRASRDIEAVLEA